MLLATILIAWTGVCAQQPPVDFKARPVISLAVGGNAVAFGKQGAEWGPTYSAMIGVGLEMSHKTRWTITPRVGLTTDAISTTFQGSRLEGRRVVDHTSKITKRYWGAMVGVEYDYAITLRWFVGGAVSLAFAEVYDWTIDRTSMPQPKPTSITMEEELDGMGGIIPFLCPQLVCGYAYNERFKFRCIMSYGIGAEGNGWTYSFPRESTCSIEFSVQWALR